MAGRNYPKLSIEDFGKHLLTTKDLDPIYLGLHQVQRADQWPVAKLFRWLLAYWCFYDAGVASFLSELEGESFWQQFWLAAENQSEQCPAVPFDAHRTNTGWPRGKERRHFRGAQATKATDELRAKYPDPADAVRFLTGNDSFGSLTYKDLKARVTTWRGFGDWIAYKVGDMLDRISVKDVIFDFDDAMYAEPHKAALLLWKVKHNVPEASTIDDEPAAVREMVEYLVDHFAGYRAPPLDDRPVGLQEIETILCKWKSHLNGHYPLFNDIDEIAHGVAPWTGVCDTARRFAEFLPKKG